MSKAKHTPGPWKVFISSWENSLICAEDGTLIAICKINADVTEDTQDEFESIKNYNADLLADAWQLPNLRREIAELKAINKEMYEALEAIAVKLDMMRPINPFEYGEIRDEIINDIKVIHKTRGGDKQ